MKFQKKKKKLNLNPIKWNGIIICTTFFEIIGFNLLLFEISKWNLLLLE